MKWTLRRPKRNRVEYVAEDRGYTSPCWTWIRAKSAQGYGMVTIANAQFLVHRLLYEDRFGAIPAELELDHLCRNRDCVNPAHLSVGTQSENINDMWSKSRHPVRPKGAWH